MASSFLLDPDAVLDFVFDFSAWLGPSETITSQTVTADTGVTVGAVTQSAGVVTVWLSGGVLGSTVRVTCHIVTDQGREDDRSFRVNVVDR